jgi:hypothetical protein
MGRDCRRSIVTNKLCAFSSLASAVTRPPPRATGHPQSDERARTTETDHCRRLKHDLYPHCVPNERTSRSSLPRPSGCACGREVDGAERDDQPRARLRATRRWFIPYFPQCKMPTGTGKTSAQTDTFHGRFVKLAENRQVVQVVEFETHDPAMRGEMTITCTLTDAEDGTYVLWEHEGYRAAFHPPTFTEGSLRRGLQLARAAAQLRLSGEEPKVSGLPALSSLLHSLFGTKLPLRIYAGSRRTRESSRCPDSISINT